MKFLVADDNQDLVELIELFIQARMKVEVVKAYDGQKALDLFFFQEPFDLVISDYNMPALNGGQLYKEIRKTNKKVPFILVTSDLHKDHLEFKNDPFFGYLEKPFVEDDLFKMISKFIDFKADEKSKDDLLVKEFQSDENAFVPVDLELIKKINFLREPLYLKISHQKFVKVLHGNHNFSEEEYRKYKNKGVEFLYVDRFDFENFITNYRRTVFFNEFWDKLTPVESTDVLATDLDLVNKASKVFGWSPAVIELAKKNIQNVLALAEKSPNFSNLREIFQSRKCVRLATHAIILNYMMTACLKNLGWTQNNEVQKLAFAALIHDMYLDEDLFTTKLTLLLQSDIHLFATTPETEKIILHPQKSAHIVSQWAIAPPDVDTIIEQHHERPDGSGWPQGLKDSQINSLAAVFIVCEDVLYHCLENFNVDPKEYLKAKKQTYTREPFNLIYQAVLQTLV